MLSRRTFIGTLASLLLFPLSAFTRGRSKLKIPPNGPGTSRARIMWIGWAGRDSDGKPRIIGWGVDCKGTTTTGLNFTTNDDDPCLGGWSFNELEHIYQHREEMGREHGGPFVFRDGRALRASRDNQALRVQPCQLKS